MTAELPLKCYWSTALEVLVNLVHQKCDTNHPYRHSYLAQYWRRGRVILRCQKPPVKCNNFSKLHFPTRTYRTHVSPINKAKEHFNEYTEQSCSTRMSYCFRILPVAKGIQNHAPQDIAKTLTLVCGISQTSRADPTDWFFRSNDDDKSESSRQFIIIYRQSKLHHYLHSYMSETNGRPHAYRTATSTFRRTNSRHCSC